MSGNSKNMKMLFLKFPEKVFHLLFKQALRHLGIGRILANISANQKLSSIR